MPAGQYTLTLGGTNVRSVLETYDIGSSEELRVDIIIRRGRLEMVEVEPEIVEDSTFIVTNTGQVPATVKARGPKSLTVSVGAGGSKRINVPAGGYSFLVYAKGKLVGEESYTIGVGEEYEYKFEVVIRRFR